MAGWREWCGLPDLGIPAIEAKLDSGARTAVLHAGKIEPYVEDGRPMVRFSVRPSRDPDGPEQECRAEIIGRRRVKNTGGVARGRIVIRTRLVLAGQSRPIDLGLADRAQMTYRMLLGRSSLAALGLLVDPSRSHLLGARP